MSIDENENRPESDERAIQVANCTLYVGRIRIVVDPRLNSDFTSIAEIRATENHDGSSVNTPPKQTDFVGVRSTKPRSQRQPITTPYAARPNTTKVGPTSRQKSVCQRPATSQLSCCLHGSGRCNYEARAGAGSDNCTAGNDKCIAGSDNCIAGTDDCNAAARNGDTSRRNSSGRSTIWGTQNGGRLSPLRLGSRDQNVTKPDWTTPSRIPVPCPSQPKPPSRQDRPVDLYAGSRLPVPVRPGPAAARILQINRAGDVRPPSPNDGRSGRRCVTDDHLNGRQCVTADKPPDTDDKPPDTDDKPPDTDDKPPDTDDKPHDVVDLLDYDDTAVEPGQPSVRIDESAASATSEQAPDDRSSTAGSQPVTVESDGLSDASDRPSLQQPVGQNESAGMTVPTPVVADDDDDSQLCNVHSSVHQSATV